MIRVHTLLTVMLLLFLTGCAGKSAGGPTASSKTIFAQGLVDSSTAVLEHFLSGDADNGIAFLVENAAGIMIFPSVAEFGYIGSFTGGSGVSCARTGSGWSYPTFMALGGGGFGLQLGIKRGPVMILFMSRELFDDARKGGMEFQARGGFTVLNVSEGQTTSSTVAGIDAYIFVDWEGFYAGASFGGMAVSEREPLNVAYYGVHDVTAEEILYDGVRVNFGADGLRGLLNETRHRKKKKDGDIPVLGLSWGE